MIHCPYCLYKNVAHVTICGNCKSVLPVETPSHKILSYTSPSPDSDDDVLASYSSQTAISSSNLAFQAPIYQVNRMTISSMKRTPHPSEAQASEMLPPAPDPSLPPSNLRPVEAQTVRTIPMSTTTARMVISKRRAFAGYGIPIKHRSFLLPREGVEASRVLQEIGAILHTRYPSLQILFAAQRERGGRVEERRYLVLRRGVSTIFIYATPIDDDLYISRSTSMLRSISPVRVIALVLMIMALFFPLYVLPILSAATKLGILAAPSIIPILEPLAALISLIGFVMLGWYLVRSFAYWLREKDFKVYLRALFLKDFELDDIMLLEHVADATIRSAVDKLGLDASQITPPQEGYQQDRHIRLS